MADRRAAAPEVDRGPVAPGGQVCVFNYSIFLRGLLSMCFSRFRSSPQGSRSTSGLRTECTIFSVPVVESSRRARQAPGAPTAQRLVAPVIGQAKTSVVPSSAPVVQQGPVAPGGQACVFNYSPLLRGLLSMCFSRF